MGKRSTNETMSHLRAFARLPVHRNYEAPVQTSQAEPDLPQLTDAHSAYVGVWKSASTNSRKRMVSLVIRFLRRASGAVLERLSACGREFTEWYQALLRALPGELGCWVRNCSYGFRGSPGVRVLSHVIIYNPQKLKIGADTGISPCCQIHAGGGVVIGRDVLIGPNVMIWSKSHNWRESSIAIRLQGWRLEEIVIEDDVWIGAGAIILPGVRLARGTVVAAGAVVTRSTDANTVVAGIPARRIAKRDDEPSLLMPLEERPRCSNLPAGRQTTDPGGSVCV
jgi:maltose O-acetyltransferase